MMILHQLALQNILSCCITGRRGENEEQSGVAVKTGRSWESRLMSLIRQSSIVRMSIAIITLASCVCWYCAVTVQIQCWYNANTVLILHWADTTLMLYWYCADTVLILCWHGASTVIITLCWYNADNYNFLIQSTDCADTTLCRQLVKLCGYNADNMLSLW